MSRKELLKFGSLLAGPLFVGGSAWLIPGGAASIATIPTGVAQGRGGKMGSGTLIGVATTRQGCK